MHPVTRVGRVVQQLRSFDKLHASELEALALELDAADLGPLAAKVRAFVGLQRDEAQLVIDELMDIQGDIVAAAARPPAEPEQAAEHAWRASPKRAQWLAEQTRPRSRRELFGRG
jgi:hypothetical protein